ncbi:hypothetical protein Ngar_c02320 [Candidatus Nitrososphaera gargensis Ga9.2]|uniref:Uncharacterized protein n=1 Tax=Nitrososphaera gargensis (strain Ga9.2) TaxID=1237085 RepID=K0ICB6_NITGG|nr:hypothetical protein [Candidatus Nitrososphaera gargensis]AFU57180.1 hypothetical protein Ngar_c02320 [Candidatus Nitrososphaera gargensis Ga9.2]
MTNNADDTQEEKDFRSKYAHELQKKKMQSYANWHFGLDEISDELARVKHQAMITPGRRGEQIKYEEINKEILRRISIGHPVKQDK